MYCYIDNLKQLLISVWAEFKQSIIDKAIDQWRPRLRACVHANGLDWIRLSSVLRPHQHSIGYMSDGFTGKRLNQHPNGQHFEQLVN